MTSYIMAAARIAARKIGRAVLVVDRFAITPETSDRVFGIAPIRVVSEQRPQAIAFGLLSGPPRIITIPNPLGRSSQELEPFADALNEYVVEALRNDRMPRIWLPHQSALELLDILGHRYRTNKQASQKLQQMGAQCRAFVEEAKYSGQQAVAIAGDLLRSHVATGQSAVEDAHVDALLAWIDPPDGTAAASEASARSLYPAASMLERADDDKVENLRVRAKKLKGQARQDTFSQIDCLLRAAAEREWDLLVRARTAYWSLPLNVLPLDKLVAASTGRLLFALMNSPDPPSNPHSLARLLHEYEDALEITEDISVRYDNTAWERARRKGKAFAAVVIDVHQPNPSRNPCTLFLRTRQPVLRLRPGAKWALIDGKVEGRVRSVTEDAHGNTIIEFLLEKGVRKSQRPGIGSVGRYVDSVPFGGHFLHDKVMKAVKQRRPAIAYDTNLPAPSGRLLPEGSLVTLGEGLRQR
jgi:hypothetical protein